MERNTGIKKDGESVYQRQNRAIHEARRQLGMSLDDCRSLAGTIGQRDSISALTLEERWELIEELKGKGAKVVNPRIHQPRPDAGEYYGRRLAFWKKRFPNGRPGYAGPKQLAWIEALWELDFKDERENAAGLRGFIQRQTRNLEDGPVSDLAFLRDHHVEAVITPLKLKARRNMEGKKNQRRRAAGTV